MLRDFGLQTAVVGGAFTLMFCGGLAQAQLVNGNLDLTTPRDILVPLGPSTPTGWVLEESRAITGPFNDAAASEGFAGGAASPVTGPPDNGLFFKPFQGNTTDGDVTAHLYQNTVGVVGQSYVLTGWAGADPGYSGLIPGSRTRSEFAIEFDTDNNRGNGSISSVILDLRAAGLTSGPGFGYQQFSLMGTAPVGTLFVRARASMIDGFNNAGGQAFVVDDFALVPEPTSFALISLAGMALAARRRK